MANITLVDKNGKREEAKKTSGGKPAALSAKRSLLHT